MIESLEFKEPEHVDKDEVDEAKLVELYSHFGSYLESDSEPVETLNDLERFYGDCSNELLYLKENRLIRTIVNDNLQVKLHDRERKLAEDIHNLELNGSRPTEIVENKELLPSYIRNPELPGYEDFREKESWGTQSPPLEIINRLINAVPREEGFKPQRINEEMNVETNFQIENWLRYLETQEVLKKGNRKYSLQNSDEVIRLLERSERNQLESLKQRQRHQNNPWKI